MLSADHEEVVRHALFRSVLAPACQGFGQSDRLGQGRLARAVMGPWLDQSLCRAREGREMKARMGDCAFFPDAE